MNYKNYIYPVIFAIITLTTPSVLWAKEFTLGHKFTQPGIVFAFEAAPRDRIRPNHYHLKEQNTDLHLEVLANWSEKKTPKGATPGGFVPYLVISAEVTNNRTKRSQWYELTPHINLKDNFHYARNIALPGKKSDQYSVTFYVRPPVEGIIGFHKDWYELNGGKLFNEFKYQITAVDFSAVAKARRK